MATQAKEIPSVANPREKTVRLISSIVLALIGISFLIPLAWVLFASFNPTATVSLSVPEHFTTENYTDIATFDRTWLPLWNSAILSFGTPTRFLVTRVVSLADLCTRFFSEPACPLRH